MRVTVKVDMPSTSQFVRGLGVNEKGSAQRFHTLNINRRIGKYMPHLTGALETKLKYVHSNTEIEVLGPYANYQYHGKVMVDSKTGKGPAYIPGIGYRFRKGAILKATDRDLEYTKTFNRKAGPQWDKALVRGEGRAMTADLQRYINRKAGPYWDRAMIAAEGAVIAQDLKSYVARRFK